MCIWIITRSLAFHLCTQSAYVFFFKCLKFFFPTFIIVMQGSHTLDISNFPTKTTRFPQLFRGKIHNFSLFFKRMSEWFCRLFSWQISNLFQVGNGQNQISNRCGNHEYGHDKFCSLYQVQSISITLCFFTNIIAPYVSLDQLTKTYL